MITLASPITIAPVPIEISNTRSSWQNTLPASDTRPFKKLTLLKATSAVLIGSVVYKACVAIALRNFEPQAMKLITAVLFLAILVLGMERRKKVKTDAGA